MSDNHWGMPGPGGSVGKCAVCGEDFALDIIRSVFGMEAEITAFGVGFLDCTMYAHNKECVPALKKAFEENEGNPAGLHNALPEGPLRRAIEDILESMEEKEKKEQ